MARPLRLEFEGAWYHVMNRGAGRRDIFADDSHRERFLELLGALLERFGVETHAYCLMDNHYHLLLHTPEANLSRAMRHLDGVYTQHFNRSTATDGPLFRGRYRSIVVDADQYLLEVSRYIHRNPLDAGIVDNLSDYPWSSYRAYAMDADVMPWLQRATIRSAISPRPERYREFVEGGAGDPLAADFDKTGILGDEALPRTTPRRPGARVARSRSKLLSRGLYRLPRGARLGKPRHSRCNALPKFDDKLGQLGQCRFSCCLGWQRQLEATCYDARYGEVLVKSLPSKGITVDLESNGFQLLLGCPAEYPESVGGETEDSSISQFHIHDSTISPGPDRARFNFSGCDIHGISPPRSVYAHRPAAQSHEPHGQEYRGYAPTRPVRARIYIPHQDFAHEYAAALRLRPSRSGTESSEP